MNLAQLRLLGFDESEHIPFTNRYRVKCSQCQACTVNGIPCHETECPNQKHECKGCNALIDHKGYCADCQ